VTKKEPTRKAIADEEVPFSLGAHEEGFARRVLPPKRREPTRKQLLTRRALSLSPPDEVRSAVWLGCPEEGNHWWQDLLPGALLRDSHDGKVDWFGSHGEIDQNEARPSW
jgi:hypothetical protein